MSDCRLGYYFARIGGSDKITTVACWGEKVEKDVNESVEVLEKIPPSVIKCCSKGVRILNLKKTMGRCYD